MPAATQIRCPSCSGPLQPVALTCPACELRIEGRFEQNEFAGLSGDDLHLLRIFVHTEGRIREMESALGLSYPTIKNRLADLRAKLAPTPDTSVVPLAQGTAPARPEPNTNVAERGAGAGGSGSGGGPPGSAPRANRGGSSPPPPSSSSQITSALDALESGEMSFEQVLSEIRGNASAVGRRRGNPKGDRT